VPDLFFISETGSLNYSTMPAHEDNIKQHFKGTFLAEPWLLKQKLQQVRAFVFDWDGVFNNGEKKENGSSAFNEVDAMGTNLLRFNYFLRNKKMPAVAVITGERNMSAFTLAEREKWNAVYYKMKSKTAAFEHFCDLNYIQPSEVAFFFDDVLDFSVAAMAGLRIMIGRNANPLLVQYAQEQQLVDYITAHDGGHHGIRESVELLTGLSGQYEETIQHRAQYSGTYREYLIQRDKVEPELYTLDQLKKIVKE
jgi:3-deoxy-D-manno-octulosonate 8-phosphate phosphatase (KDO 8-P phosphatase)